MVYVSVVCVDECGDVGSRCGCGCVSDCGRSRRRVFRVDVSTRALIDVK